MVLVIGAGLAGTEAAWQIAKAGLPVRLGEMRPGRRSLKTTRWRILPEAVSSS